MEAGVKLLIEGAAVDDAQALAVCLRLAIDSLGPDDLLTDDECAGLSILAHLVEQAVSECYRQYDEVMAKLNPQ